MTREYDTVWERILCLYVVHLEPVCVEWNTTLSVYSLFVSLFH